MEGLFLLLAAENQEIKKALKVLKDVIRKMVLLIAYNGS